MSWGYGHSPVFKDKCYAYLIIGWGPLLQSFILNDVMEQDQIFFDDGYYVLQADNSVNEEEALAAQALAQEEQKKQEILTEINPFI